MSREAYNFFEQHYARVRAFIASIVRQNWIAEDLTQEVFIRAFKNLSALKDTGNAKPWLFRIAKNLCTDHFRREQTGVQKDKSTMDASLVPVSSQQERILELREMTDCVRNHFQLLPENLRTVLWLFDIEGMTHKEISKVLDIDVGNVKVRLHRARSKMKEILKTNCNFDRDDRNVFICVPPDRREQNGLP